jgi:arabinan endo-1,5-alpha-L-arabinosidase
MKVIRYKISYGHPYYLFFILLIIALLTACKNDDSYSTYRYPHNTYAHDPSLIKQDSTYYVFYTGDGIQMISSKDSYTWTKPTKVFDAPADWMTEKIPGFENFIWAPDVSYYNGTYYLFYALSSFGINNSAIGVATNTTLDSKAPAYKWVDHGKVIESFNNITPWNAIDPNVITDEAGTPWLVFGSFYTGIHIVKLSPDRLSVAESTENMPIIASRDNKYRNWDPALGPGVNNIEGAVIFKHNNYYYLFASVDVCCQALNSTYKIIVGRSANVTGPYLDMMNRPMDNGGQLIAASSDANWHGTGGQFVYHMNNADYIAFHAYDVHDQGIAKLRIQPITWDNKGWPHFKNLY